MTTGYEDYDWGDVEPGAACYVCGEHIPEYDVVWIDPTTTRATMFGQPYHPGCAPAEVI